MSDDPLAGADLAEPPLIALVARATGLSDMELAMRLDVARATVNTWRNGRVSERYTKHQRATLWDLLMRQRLLLGAAIARISS